MKASLRPSAFSAVIRVLCLLTILSCSEKGPKAKLVEPVAPGSTLAGEVVHRDELLKGPKAEGRLGDFKLMNSEVSFIIEGPRASSGYLTYGGLVVDAARAGGLDYFEEAGLIVNLRSFRAEEIAVVNPGGAGVAAVVRAQGLLDIVPIVNEMLPVQIGEGSMEIVYTLEPDSSRLRMDVRVTNTGEKRETFQAGAMFLFGDHVKRYVPGAGFDTGQYAGRVVDLFGGIGRDVGYGWLSPKEDMTIILNILDVFVILGDSAPLAPDESFEMTRYLIVSEGSVESLMDAKAAALGIGRPQGRIEGVVGGVAFDEAQDVEIHVTQVQDEIVRHVTMTRPAADGSFAVSVEPGEYDVAALAPGRKRQDFGKVEIQAGVIKRMEFSLPLPGRLSYEMVDAEGLALPAKLTVAFSDPAAADAGDALLGEPSRPDGIQTLVFSHLGHGEERIEPGAYTITASRGFEYTIESAPVVVTPGETAGFRATLSRVVDTGEYRSGDFHIHAMPSPDSEDLLEMKVQAFAAEGLELPVSTDHDRLTDFEPIIRELGLSERLKSFIGDEISTNVKGHFNAYPLEFLPLARNFGAVDWFGLPIPMVVETARESNAGDELVQLNHPRGSSAYFNHVDFDPSAGMGRKNSDDFTTAFDAIEVFNGKRKDDTREVLRDWYGLLNHGVFLTAMGNSDSHSAAQKQEVGYPRTYIRFPGVKSVTEIGKSDLIRAIRSGDASVCAGPFVTIEADGRSMGSTVTAEGGAVDLAVKVQAPPWMRVDRVKIMVNGTEREDLRAQVAESRDPIRFEKTISLSVASDSWVIAIAEGDADLSPVVLGATPLSFTNPIFIDTDGNGRFDP